MTTIQGGDCYSSPTGAHGVRLEQVTSGAVERCIHCGLSWPREPFFSTSPYQYEVTGGFVGLDAWKATR